MHEEPLRDAINKFITVNNLVRLHLCPGMIREPYILEVNGYGECQRCKKRVKIALIEEL